MASSGTTPSTFWTTIERWGWLAAIAAFLIPLAKDIFPENIYKYIAVITWLFCSSIISYWILFRLFKFLQTHTGALRRTLSILSILLSLLITSQTNVVQKLFNNINSPESQPTATPHTNQASSQKIEPKPDDSFLSVIPASISDNSNISEELYFHPQYDYAGIRFIFSEP
jgi:hypothetical protein